MRTLFTQHETWWEKQWAWAGAHKALSTSVAGVVTLGLIAVIAYRTVQGMQAPDPDFDSAVAHPAYTTDHPRVVIDEAHLNFHTSGFRYRPLADLLRHDGYAVEAGRKPFSREGLAGVRVLVVANALGWKGVAAMLLNLARVRSALEWDMSGALPAEECAAVAAWVNGGGSLLLVADHKPSGSAASGLARAFGVEMSNGYTEDIPHHDPESDNWNFIIFSRADGTLLAHPVTDGRGPMERVEKVMTFTGQSLAGPPGSVPFLLLSPTAEDYPGMWATKEYGRSAAGRAQGLALRYGRGRVVVMGEAAMLTAQVARGLGREYRFGMEHKGYDDRQLALNIAHWLSGLLD
jgi:hypothetical protein